MERLEKILETIEKDLQEVDKAIGELLPLIRKGIKSASKAITSIHQGEFTKSETYLETTASILKEVKEKAKTHTHTRKGNITLNLEQEYAEAVLLTQITKDKPIIGPEEIGVSQAAYVLGLLDTIGELRRYILNRLRKGKEEEAENFLKLMEEIYAVITTPMLPHNLIPGVRRKMDAARRTIERTRGDLTNALHREKLRKTLVDALKKYEK